MGPPNELVLLIKKLLGATNFIESGTYRGETAKWASEHFDQVDTIEFSKLFFDELVSRYKESSNLNLHFGDSREILKDLLPITKESTIFWLDGHWCGDIESYGESDQCPLIGEIDAIVSSNVPTYAILIDDARLFLSPPPKPHKIKQWPTIDNIIECVKKGMVDPYIIVYHDVIVVIPGSIMPEIADFVQDENTREWKNKGIKNKGSLFSPVITMINGRFVTPVMRYYRK